MSTKPHLISFKICPFVQRSVITMREKGVECDVTYIDLANKPDWFLKLSPLGKVPVLQVGEEVLFESAVINEYLDETNAPAYHPADPLQRGKNRAWIEFISQILVDQYRNSVAGTEADFHQHLDAAREKIERLETIHRGPYFNGDEFSLVDAAIAPAFTRFAVLDEALGDRLQLNLYAKAPKIGEWADRLIARDSVQSSVVPEFAELYIDYLRQNGAYPASLLD
ncbi:MAG: glutathione S-transferase family protein [bacterium]|nr:glutathione S-transferase family protein [bacterium]